MDIQKHLLEKQETGYQQTQQLSLGMIIEIISPMLVVVRYLLGTINQVTEDMLSNQLVLTDQPL
jgi:hypothetical protein